MSFSIRSISISQLFAPLKSAAVFHNYSSLLRPIMIWTILNSYIKETSDYFKKKIE